MPYSGSRYLDPNANANANANPNASASPYNNWTPSPGGQPTYDAMYELDALPDNQFSHDSTFGVAATPGNPYSVGESQSMTAGFHEPTEIHSIRQDFPATTRRTTSLPSSTYNLERVLQSSSRERSPARKSSTSPSADSRTRQRNLNTLAARRYRQRRTDETQSLAAELKETQAERDELKVKVARLEGELDALRQMLQVREASQST